MDGQFNAYLLAGTVLPIFDKSGFSYDLVVTKRPNHARDLVAHEDLRRWAAVIILSGDGLLYETYQVGGERDLRRHQYIAVALELYGCGSSLFGRRSALWF